MPTPEEVKQASVMVERQLGLLEDDRKVLETLRDRLSKEHQSAEATLLALLAHLEEGKKGQIAEGKAQLEMLKSLSGG